MVQPPVILPYSSLYNLIPMYGTHTLRSLMRKAIEVSHANNRFLGCLHAFTAVPLSLVQSIGFCATTPVHLVVAILYVFSSRRKEFFKIVIQDLRSAYNCLIFSAALTIYIFATIFIPCKFSFKDILPKQFPSIQPKIQSSESLKDRGFLDTISQQLREKNIRPFPSWAVHQPVDILYNGTVFNVNINDPSLLYALSKIEDSITFNWPQEIPIVIGENTLYIDLESLKKGSNLKTVVNHFEQQIKLSDADFFKAIDQVVQLKIGEISLLTKICHLFTGDQNSIRKAYAAEYLHLMGARLEGKLTLEQIALYHSSKELAERLRKALYEPIKYFRTSQKAYEAMVDALCEAQKLRRDGISLPKFFSDAFIARYTLDFKEHFEKITSPYTDWIKPEQFSLPNAWKIFSTVNTMLHDLTDVCKTTQWLQMFRGEVGFHFNPSYHENKPTRTAVLSCEGKDISLLRHSTPCSQYDGAVARLTLAATQKTLSRKNSESVAKVLKLNEKSKEGTAITEDFRGFIESAKANGKKILHCISEFRNKPLENSRYECRTELDKEYENFSVLSLPMDGDFFNRKGAFKEIKSFEELRKKLVDVIDKSDEGFYLSKEIKLERIALEKLFDEVHTIYFDNRFDIGITQECDEYQAFLLLYYTHLKAYLTKTYGFDYLSGGCKDFLDRAGIFEAIFSIFILMLLNRENNPDDIKAILTNLWAPPLLVKGKGVVKERAERLKYVLHVFTQMSDKSKEALRNGCFKDLFTGFEFR